jgi:hypothetical protein
MDIKMRKMLLEESGNCEELFVLASAINSQNKDELENFINELVTLTNEGYLKCWRGKSELQQLSLIELDAYIKERINEGQNLTDVPKDFAKEFSWETTEKGWDLKISYDKRIAEWRKCQVPKTFVNDKIKRMILKEAEYGENLYLLATAINYDDNEEFQTFLNELVLLTNEGHLKCWSGRNEIKPLSLDDLKGYIKNRISQGQKLTDVPNDWEKEYSWRTTESGREIAKSIASFFN